MLTMPYLTVKELPSPIGTLKLISDDQCLLNILFPRDTVDQSLSFWSLALGADYRVDSRLPAVLDLAARQLDEYFSGRRKKFDVPLRFYGTVFQERVWNALMEIPYGQTVSYRDIGRKIENPRAVRAVGSANGRNRIPIIVPCHRVINASGKLGGYGGGLDIKKWLLEHEANHSRP